MLFFAIFFILFMARVASAEVDPYFPYDEYILPYFARQFANMTDKCNPRYPAVPLVLGSDEFTKTSWTSLRKELSATCDFSGLDIIEMMSKESLDSPLHICYTYSTAGFQIVKYVYLFKIPYDFLSRLINVYEIAFPLNLYWFRSPFSSFDVASAYIDQVQAYIRDVDQVIEYILSKSESENPPDIHKYRSAFCDVYFNQKESAQDIDPEL